MMKFGLQREGGITRPRPFHRQPVRLGGGCRRERWRHTTAVLPDGELQWRAEQWLSLDKDPDSAAVIQKIVDEGWDLDLARELLARRLQFGTAGLRGKMGPGFNRMNAVTVQQTTQGLLWYLDNEFWGEALKQLGVVIGYDGRHHSREFAHVAAAVCVSKGVPVYLFSDLVPTPLVPTAVRFMGAAAGIMITASHNPKDDNGYKVYWSNGCQIVPPLDVGIAAAIEANLELWELDPAVVEDPYSDPLVGDPLAEVSAEYMEKLAIKLQARYAEANASAPPMVYTALHGVGAPWVQQAFSRFGLPPPILVPEQCTPDPDFPTVSFPNPEEGEGAWALAYRTAEQHGANLAFATDPDADRFAVAERDAETGQWRAFTGNEIGAMLAHWVLKTYLVKDDAAPPERLALLSSTVSSRMLESIAETEGMYWQETLTGFKWLGNEALKLGMEGYTTLFAFEEAIGFMFGEVGRDKDGVAASAVFGELAAEVYSRGLTLAQQWQLLQEEYGVYEYRSGYFLADPPHLSYGVFERLRYGYPEFIGGQRVVSVRDLGTGVDTAQEDGQAVLPWNQGDLMITYTLEGPAVITLRASGTEPKLKYYLEVLPKRARVEDEEGEGEGEGAEGEEGAAGEGGDGNGGGGEGGEGEGEPEVLLTQAELADKLEKAVEEELVRPWDHGLTRPQRPHQAEAGEGEGEGQQQGEGQ